MIAPFVPPYVNIPEPGQPYLWMMIGPPGSGKSSWVSRLMTRSSVPKVLIGTDHWIDCLAYTERDAGRVDSECIERDHMAQFDAAVAARAHIVVDRTNMTLASRSRWLNRLPQGVYYRQAVVFALSRDALDERLAARAEVTGKIIPTGVVDSMIDNYQPPVLGEFEAVLRGGELQGFPSR